LLVYFVGRRRFEVGALRVLSVTVQATLAGTALALWAMHALSLPTALASRALRRYLETGELPELPAHYTDRAGDACLIHFAEVLGRNLRAGDWISRWGGDEFVVGMWNTQEGKTTERALGRIADDLRQNPAVLPDGRELRLTFSGGTCRWRQGDASGLVSKADGALYRAKAESGNTNRAPRLKRMAGVLTPAIRAFQPVSTSARQKG